MRISIKNIWNDPTIDSSTLIICNFLVNIHVKLVISKRFYVADLLWALSIWLWQGFFIFKVYTLKRQLTVRIVLGFMLELLKSDLLTPKQVSNIRCYIAKISQGFASAHPEKQRICWHALKKWQVSSQDLYPKTPTPQLDNTDLIINFYWPLNPCQTSVVSSPKSHRDLHQHIPKNIRYADRPPKSW